MKFEKLQENVELIRNICIIGHIDHGKTTLTDSLLSSNGIISQKLAGQLRYLDSRKDEQERGITMEASGISLFFMRITATEKLEYLINLIDSPGHVDFSCEVSSASRLCDGALLLVDAVEGVCAQTYTVLRQAINEKVKPVLVLNKIDRLITEWKQTPEEAFIHLSQILEQVNAILGTYQAEEMMNNEHADTDSEGDYFFNPENGNVIFASAIDGWAFRTTQFAQLYASKLNVDHQTLNKFMWGKNYLDPKTKRVIGPKGLKGRPLKPLFVQFALENVWALYDTVLSSNDPAKIEKIVTSLGVKIAPRELKSKETRPLLQSIMSQWLPLTGAVLLAVVQKLPDPKQAQAYKMKPILEIKSPYFKLEESLKDAVLNCNSADDVPVVAFLSKIFSISSSELPIPTQELNNNVFAAQEARKLAILRSKARAAAREAEGNDGAHLELDTQSLLLQQGPEDSEVFIGFGRIFSGCIKVGQTIKVLGPKYDFSDSTSQKYVTDMKVSRLFLLMGKELRDLDKVPAGNVFGILITNDEILKTATLSSTIQCPNFAGVKMDAPPILRVALEPSDPTQLAQLLAGLKLLDRSDPAVQVELEATGENVIVCAGELHLERCLKDLRERFARIEIEASEPLVPYRETISSLPSIQAAEKKVSLSSLGRILKTTPALEVQIRVIPLPARFRNFLMNTKMEKSVNFAKQLSAIWKDIANEGGFNTEFDVDWSSMLEGIICFGPNSLGPNLLVNNISGATMSLFNEPDEYSGFKYESSIISAFQLAVASGPLCAEPVVGIAVLLERFEIDESKAEQTFLPGQILSVFKDSVKQGFLEWSPRLMLAMYTCDLQTDPQYLGKVDGVLSRRRGKILSEDIKDGSTIFTLGASLSVVESFGFVDGIYNCLKLELRKKTSGVASPQLVFAGFEVLDLDPFWVPTTEEELEDFGTIADRQNLAKFYMEKVRLRKGLAIEKKLVEHADKQRNLKNK